MIMDNMWIEALKNKYRFEFKGLINVEDLFDLRLEDLDHIYKGLKRDENDLQVDSLLDANKNPLKKEIEVKINIVKTVFEMKEEEIEKAKVARANKAQKEKILAIIENKQDQELTEKSIDELRKIYNSLD
jgi:pyruvate kinase